MAPQRFFSIALLAAAVAAQRPASVWSQCGGSNYAGPTACVSGNYCNYGNPWYSQCVPGSADDPLDGGIPDSPLITNTAQTIVTIGAGGQDPTIVTTSYTYVLPSTTILATHKPTQTGGGSSISISSGGGALPSTTVIAGTTYTIIRDSPVTNDKRPEGARTNVAARATTAFKYKYDDSSSNSNNGGLVPDERVASSAQPTPTVSWTTIVTVERA